MRYSLHRGWRLGWFIFYFVLVNSYPCNAVKSIFNDQNKKEYGSTKTSLTVQTVRIVCMQEVFVLNMQLSLMWFFKNLFWLCFFGANFFARSKIHICQGLRTLTALLFSIFDERMIKSLILLKKYCRHVNAIWQFRIYLFNHP